MGRKRGGIQTPQMDAVRQQADQIRGRLVAAQQAAAKKVVEGVSADELVRIEIGGDMSVKDVHIDPAGVSDVAQLEASIAEALAAAVLKVTQLRSGSTGGVDLSSINLGGTPLT